MGKDKLKVIKKILLIVIFIILLIVFFSLLIITKDNGLIKNIKEYVKVDTKVLYISDKKNYNKYPIELFKQYEVNYMYINSNKLSQIEKSKLERIINSKYLSSIIVVFKDNKIVDAIIEYDSKESLNKFLQKYEIIPEELEDNSNIIPNVNELLEDDHAIIYLPYKNEDYISKQDKILKEIAEEYKINYKKIKAYLLSNSQKEKLNSLLQISSVDDQIIILVKNGNIIGSIRDIGNKKEYLNSFKEFNFIEEISNYITYINYSKFNDLLNNDNINIITIGKDDCKYCESVLKTLNTIAINYNIDVNYISVGNIESDISKNIEKSLVRLGYSDGFTTPLTIIVEKNKLLDYIIGISSEEYFVDIFEENGIIK